MTNKYLELLEIQYNELRNPELAFAMSKYMKNKFEFLGINSPVRKEVYKKFLLQNGKPELNTIESIIKELWNKAEREYQYFAMTLLEKSCKTFSTDFIDLYEYIILNKSWWDTVDFIAANLTGKLFLKYPELILPNTKKWMNSGNMWLQRSCILFQLKYKNNTDFELLKSFIVPCKSSKEFFIQKAIGWSLREYSKTNPEAVVEFIKHNQLVPLSIREGLKWVNRK